LTQRFDRCRLERPAQVVLVDETVRLTAGTLIDLGDTLAAGLADLGTGPGDVVAFQLPCWWEAAVVSCAAFRLGATLSPLPTNVSTDELAVLVDQARPRVLFAEGDRGGPDARHGVATMFVTVRSEAPGPVSFEDLISREGSAPAGRAGDAPGPALLLFTSGSTGRPKGVLHGGPGLLAKIDDLSRAHELTHEDVVLAPYAPFHIGGIVYNLLMPLGIGTRAVLMGRWDAGRALDALDDEGVTFVSAVPTQFHQLLAHGRFRPERVERVRLAALGGTRVVPEDVELVERTFEAVAKRSYGSTEVPTVTTSRNDDPLTTRANTDGRPIGSAQLLVVDDRGSPLPASSEGELYVKGPSILLGYLDPVDDLEAFTGDGWFKTGDVATIDADGRLTITGRVKDLIIRGGENIAPGEIERWLIKHPAVDEVAVVGMPDPVMGERACAFVATRDPDFSFERMITWLRDNAVPVRKLPERLETRRALPTTSTGKVRKDLLRAEIARLCGQDVPADCPSE
jgi:cyclohexanecarboxylate-CoA ligase